jgi:hypothetical protein
MKTTIIAEHRCKDRTALAAISSVGPAELERYSDEVLAIVTPGSGSYLTAEHEVRVSSTWSVEGGH